MSTIDRAVEVISLALADDADVSIAGNYNDITTVSEATLDGKYDLTAVARALADAGLLKPDLPEANDPTASFVPGGKGWLLDGPEGPIGWAAPGASAMVQRIEPSDLTPEKDGLFATHLKAAADKRAKEVGTDGK